MADNKTPIIIKRIKKGGHGHHGGAWKVAYADFVTAMMAFFLLLWLLSVVPVEKLNGIANYFTPTIGVRDLKGMGSGPGSNPLAKNFDKNQHGDEAILYGSEYKGSVIKVPEASQINPLAPEAQNFSAVERDLYKALNENPDLKEAADNITIDEVPEGLRIQVLEQEKRPLFVPGTSQLQPYTQKILTALAHYLKFMPNYLSIEGHTSRNQDNKIDDWPLSAERSDVTRKFLINGLINPEQVLRIVGKADKEPIDQAHPESPRNIRISMILLRSAIVPFSQQSTPPDKKPANNYEKSLRSVQ